MGGSPRPRPTRTCVACRTERDKRALVRVVRTPDGLTTLDPTGRLAGRGAYLCADGACWQAALKRRSIEHALGVSLAPELRARLSAGPEPTRTPTEGGSSGT
ncbi:MAG: YlxR family protein [Chloroflexota bacterium]|nr:MAG: YlxR family protein [Chloroflexota bacterium]